MTHIARGLTGVVVAETRLSEVDGEAGSLVIAGYPVEQIAPRATFEEVLFLLWHDRLPSDAEQDELRASMAARRALPAATVDLLRAAARARVGAMDALRMAVGTLSLIVDELGDGAAPLLDQAQAIVAPTPACAPATSRSRPTRGLATRRTTFTC